MRVSFVLKNKTEMRLKEVSKLEVTSTVRMKVMSKGWRNSVHHSSFLYQTALGSGS